MKNQFQRSVLALALLASMSVHADPTAPAPSIINTVASWFSGQPAATPAPAPVGQPAANVATPSPAVPTVVIAAVPREVTYGAELEFTHPKYDWNDIDIVGHAAQTAKQLFRAEVAKTCVSLGCVVTEVKGKYSNDFRVTFQDGWFFTITHDPGCIEITWKPLTLAQIKEKKEIIDQAIYGSAKSGGFSPSHEESAHFNIGIRSAFGDKATDFMRFFVDYQNNPHLALGTLGEDLDNAPPLAVLTKEQRDELEKIVNEVEAGDIKTVGQAAEEIFKRVYTSTYNPNWKSEWGAEAGVRHYQAIGLKYATVERLMKSDMPMELRSVWGTENTAGFIKIAELFEARNRFLQKQGGKIRYTKIAKKSYDTWEEAVTRFYIYVTEAGLNYDDYKSLMTAEAQESELAAFLNEKAPIQERLKSLRPYSDLIATSELFRTKVQSLMAIANKQGVRTDDSVQAKIFRARENARPMCEATLIL